MTGPPHAEVAMIQRCQFRFVQTLHHRKDCRVDKTDASIVVAVADGADSAVADWLKVLHAIGTRANVSQKRKEHSSMETRVDPVIHFHEHRCGNDQRFSCLFD